MTKIAINPFAESKITEHIAAEDFVRAFSPLIVRNATELFRHGNVVLRGTPGSGKSMLLALLRPETRMAYHRAGLAFPTPVQTTRFISTGINLTQVGVQDIGNRLSQRNPENQDQDLPFIFADFVNYHLAYDLISNIQKYLQSGIPALCAQVGLMCNTELFNRTISTIAEHQCWFGYLNGASNATQLLRQIEVRLRTYKSYFNHNLDALPENFRETRTVIGEPVAAISSTLRSTGLLADDVLVLVRVDQLEELYHLEQHFGLGSLFRQVINKALAMRDQRVSYRIGTRGYAWEENLAVFATGSRLEEDRDFSVVDLDIILRRAENRRVWRFPELAGDIFKRRLASVEFDVEGRSPNDLLQHVFGRPLPPTELARIYAGENTERALDLDVNWPQAWKDRLRELSRTSVLSAKLGCAWARQRGKTNIVHAPADSPLPWESYERRWWKKERQQQALMQIASKCGQRMIWSGSDDILELSGGNILTFITLCKHIWQSWLRTTDANGDGCLPTIEYSIQATGIYDASRTWVEKSIPQGYDGNSRARVVQKLAVLFARRLGEDKAMSNPGNNGISLTVDDYRRHENIRAVLNLGSDFGDLMVGPHTSKLADRRPRIKWYLAPILSPYFRIPHVHTKEPIYLSALELAPVLDIESIPNEVVEANSRTDVTQMSLF
ncbi:MAG: hypothetical protein V4803_04995 [Burkholderia gladioli]